MKLGQTHGALVGDVDPNGPAARAGLEPGDVIVEANGKPVENQRELRLMISAMAPGSQMNLRVLRGNQPRSAAMTLGQMPIKQTASDESTATARQKPEAPNPGQPHLGVAISDLTPDILQHLQLPATTKGVIVADVQEGSVAAESGFRLPISSRKWIGNRCTMSENSVHRLRHTVPAPFCFWSVVKDIRCMSR